jgi:beta-lactamase regulating signal transducer with metallopeptidase domain
MFTSLSDFLTAMVRATAALSLSAVIAWGVLSWFKLQSPRVGRIVWLLVLLQGIILLRIPVAIPWYPAPMRLTIPPSAIALPEKGVRNLLYDDATAHPAIEVQKKVPDTFSWQPLIFGAWLAGCGITLIWWGVVYLRIARRGAIGEQPTEEWKTEWQSLCERSGSPTIPLRITNDTGPVLVWRPKGAEVLVPRELWASLPNPQRMAILRHELAHFRRGDLWKGASIRLLALVHWFNPLAWWVVRNLEECAEWLCDDAASGADHAAATAYAEVLLRLGQQPRNLGVWATAMRGGRLHRRICRVLSPAPKEKSIMKKSLLVAIPLMLLAGNLIRVQLVARAQDATARSANDSPAKAAPKTERSAALQPLPPQRGAMMRYVLTPAVQKELGIEPDSDQLKVIMKLNAQSTQEIEERRKSVAEADRANLPRVIGELVAQRDLDLEKLLSPEQRTRIHQIMLQKTSTFLALTDPEVAKPLGLTKEQLEKLAALEKELRESQTKVYEISRRTGPTEELEKKLHQSVADYEQKIDETLTKEQQEKFIEVKGKPFTGSLAQPNSRGIVSIPTGGLMGLALRDPVLKELGIERGSATFIALQNLADKHQKLVEELFREKRQENRVDMDDIGPIAQAKFDPDLKAALTPEQFKRLRQIYWQDADFDAFDDPELVKALDVKPEQLAKIKALVVEDVRKETSMAIKNSKSNDSERLSREQLGKKRLDLRAEYETKIADTLTDDQRKKFAELKGKPFDLRSMYQSQPAAVQSDQKNDAKQSDK